MKTSQVNSSILKILALGCGVVVAILLSACSSNEAKSPDPAPARPASVRKDELDPTGKTETMTAHRSVFTLDGNVSDPFFPNAKRAAAQTEQTAPESSGPLDIASLLQTGFQGVLSSGARRIAVINNVMLEAGKQTVILISAGGASRELVVRCREVQRDSVLIEVQGYPQPFRLYQSHRL